MCWSQNAILAYWWLLIGFQMFQFDFFVSFVEGEAMKHWMQLFSENILLQVLVKEMPFKAHYLSVSIEKEKYSIILSSSLWFSAVIPQQLWLVYNSINQYSRDI